MGDIVAADSVCDEGCVQQITGQNTSNSAVASASAGKELGQRTLRSLKRGLGRIWRRHRGNASITEYDPCYKVAYLGNVLTGWAKGKSSLVICLLIRYILN